MTRGVHVFDLDGTLLDTREAVREAYRLAGVDMPDDAWGRPWRDWCPEDVHARKVAIYPRVLVDMAHPLDCYFLARRLHREGEYVGVLTAASLEAFFACARQFGMPFVMLGASMTTEQKRDRLLLLQEDIKYNLAETYVYYDDDWSAGQRVTLGTRFEFRHAAPERKNVYALHHTRGRSGK